jgi:hypothetical protein
VLTESFPSLTLYERRKCAGAVASRERGATGIVYNVFLDVSLRLVEPLHCTSPRTAAQDAADDDVSLIGKIPEASKKYVIAGNLPVTCEQA